MENIKDIFNIIAYEIQPIRPKDAVILSKWIAKNVSQITIGIKDLCVWLKDLCVKMVKYVMQLDKKSLGIVSSWFLGLAVFLRIEYGAVYIILSMMGLIFANLGTRAPGELSAYSVFNKNFRRLMGTLTAEQFDNEIRHKNNNNNNGDDDDDDDDWDIAGHNKGDRQRNNNNDLKHRKLSGKKARRGYEKKLQRRMDENVQRQAEAEAEAEAEAAAAMAEQFE